MYESYFHFVLFGRITFVLLCDGVRACVFLSFVHTRAISLYWDILRLALCWCIAALGETGITASASIVIHISFDDVFFLRVSFRLAVVFLVPYENVLPICIHNWWWCECVSVFLSFGLCIVCILAFFGVIVVSPSMVPYMYVNHIHTRTCVLA